MNGPASLRPTPAPPGWRQLRWGSRRGRLVGGLAGTVLTIVTAGLVLWLSHLANSGPKETESKVPVAWERPVVTADGLVQHSGVKITQVAVTGDGGMVDLR